MKMRWLEKRMMNNALRTWLLRRREAPRVFDGLELPAGCTCLEIGCGRGVGGLLIADRFDCARVVCADIDPYMIRKARKYLRHPPRWARRIRTEAVELVEADATALAFPEGTFDAAFLFGMLHHVADWRRAIREVARVLVPGGVFAFEEALLDRRWPVFSRYFRHAPFAAEELRQAVEAAGLDVQKLDLSFMSRLGFCRAVKPAG